MSQKYFNSQSKSTPQIDGILLGVFLIILLFGLVMVASASIPVAAKNYGDGFYFFYKQLIFAIISVCALCLMLKIPTQKLEHYGKVWLILGVIFLILVLIPGVGHTVNGSRRWIRLGPLALQVSELVKLFAVLYMAHYLSKHSESVQKDVKSVIKPLLILGIFGILLLLEPDFGATVVLFVMALGMLFMAGVNWKWFVCLILIAGLAGGALVIISPYRLARFTGFMHPWANQYTTGYQLTQALIAFGRGGWFGVGLGNSLQKLFFLPESHTDFILAITGEELGFFGVLVLLGLYSTLAWRGLKIAAKAFDQTRLFDSFLAYGITFWLVFQVIVNAGVNIGLLPTKGLTLPFFSYGGSSLLVDTVTIGILLRIDLQGKQFF